MKNRTLRVLACLLAICLCVGLLPLRAQAADYIAANHTQSNGCPYYIMVNRYCNTVTIYTLDSNGYYTVPYKAMVCSTGKYGHATPLGTYAITTYKNKWNAMVDGSYGQYASQFSGNYLFHSVCYYGTSNDQLMTEEYNALGDYASLGCVRLQVADAKWIYDNCIAGTLVTVYDGYDSGPLGKPEKVISYISAADDCGWDPTDPAYGNPWDVSLKVAVSDWSSGSGTVSGSGNYKKTQIATVTAVPDAGSCFDGWYNEAGYRISTEPTYQFRLEESIGVYALFTQPPRKIQVVASRSCTVSGAGSYTPGTAVTLKATSTAAGGFQGWYDETGWQLTTSPTMQVVAGTRDTLYYALAKGDVFADIPAGQWYTSSVMEAYQTGIIAGTSPVTFSPMQTMTRAMAVTLIARLEGIDTTAYQAHTSAFTDVSSDAYYYPAVCWAAENGIVMGTSSTHFSPDRSVTREQFMTFLMRYAVEYRGMTVAEAELTFTDADRISDYAKTPMAQACGLGILKGYEDHTIRPDGKLNRAEGTVLIMRLKEKCT